jgi:hypothetical protein
VLVDDINTGYQQFQSLAVLRVNGQPLLNLAHLRGAIAATPGPYVRLDLEDDRIIVLDKALADEATERVQDRWEGRGGGWGGGGEGRVSYRNRRCGKGRRGGALLAVLGGVDPCHAPRVVCYNLIPTISINGGTC